MRDGRPPDEGPGKTRDRRLTVRLTGEDETGMDETRGHASRADFARDAIRTAINAARGRK